MHASTAVLLLNIKKNKIKNYIFVDIFLQVFLQFLFCELYSSSEFLQICIKVGTQCRHHYLQIHHGKNLKSWEKKKKIKKFWANDHCKGWDFLEKRGHFLQKFAKIPWCESYIGQPKRGAISYSWKTNLVLVFTSAIMSVQKVQKRYKSLSTTLTSKLLHQMKICSKTVGQPLEKMYESAYQDNTVRLANNMVSEPNHVLNGEYELLPSKQRYRIPRFNKIRLKNSFLYQSILKLNMELNPRSDAC